MTTAYRSINYFPFHVLILPLFFILRINNQYAGIIGFDDAFFAFIKVFAAVVLFFILLYLFTKNRQKAAVITTVCGLVFLFFGDIKELFRPIPLLNIFYHYLFYLPLIFILTAFIIYKTAKAKKLNKANAFLNLLLMVYLLIECVSIIRIKNRNKIADEQANANDAALFQSKQPAVQSLPDIYYVLLDCYPSTSFQREVLKTDDNFFDSSLTAKGFYLVSNSTSNYNRTAFSMAATLNMKYLDWLGDVGKTVFKYNKSLSLIKHAATYELLKKNGYNFDNLSIFDIGDQQSINKENFLTTPVSQVIFFNTLWNCIWRELYWRTNRNAGKQSDQVKMNSLKKKHEPKKKYNHTVLDSIYKIVGTQKSSAPIFAYAHLYMPHFPYFYDRSGREYPADSLYTDSLITDRKKFIDYIYYTDHQIIPLIDKILQKKSRSSVVVIQSDHGLADFDFSRQSDAFRNYTAIYFPDHDYHLLYDSMSNVNTFRIILNKYLYYTFPLLNDRSFYLKN